MLRQALEALCNQNDPSVLYEIIVVDHEDATDNTADLVKAFAEKSSIPIRYLCEPRYEKHYAVNTGFKASRGEILGLIDDDVIVDTDWVKNMVEVYDDNPRASCAGGRLTLSWINGSPPDWAKEFKGVLGEVDCGNELTELTCPQTVIAGNFSIRKDILLKVGGYNPCNAIGDKLVGDGESGLCMKVYNAGGSLFQVPAATGWHVQDAQRITFAHIRRKAQYQGMSDAYTTYRLTRGKPLSILKSIARSSIHRLRKIAGILLLRHVKSWKAKFRHTLYEIEYLRGLYSYIFQIYTDRQLRQLVIRNDWLKI